MVNLTIHQVNRSIARITSCYDLTATKYNSETKGRRLNTVSHALTIGQRFNAVNNINRDMRQRLPICRELPPVGSDDYTVGP